MITSLAKIPACFGSHPSAFVSVHSAVERVIDGSLDPNDETKDLLAPCWSIQFPGMVVLHTTSAMERRYVNREIASVLLTIFEAPVERQT